MITEFRGIPSRFPNQADNEGQDINTNILTASILADNIAHVRAEGFKVDDDNEALPENIPAPGAPTVKVSADGLNQSKTWGWDGINMQATAREGYKNPPFKTAGHLITRSTSRFSPTFFPLRGLKPFCCPR